MKVMHFIPAYRSMVHVEVACQMAREATWCESEGHLHIPHFVDTIGIARTRNLAVDAAFRNECNLLFMQDADVFCHPTPEHYSVIDALCGTMCRLNVPVVGAAVIKRYTDCLNCEPAIPGREYLGEVGTGMMLIDLDRLRDFPRPWFVYKDREDGLAVECGEDIHFCRTLRGRVGVNFMLPTSHVSMIALTVPPTVLTGERHGGQPDGDTYLKGEL